MVFNITKRIRQEEVGRLRQEEFREKWFEPLFWGGNPNNPSTLLIHGFGGTPQDLKPVFDLSQNLDRTTCGFVLPGHCGTSVRDLAKVTQQDYRENAAQQLGWLHKFHPEGVDVVGFSVGGVIALDIANEPGVRSITLINPFTRVPNPWYCFGVSVRRWSDVLGGVVRYAPKRSKGHILDKNGYKAYEPSYNFVCVDAYKRIQDYATDVWGRTTGVKTPVCYIYAPQDAVSHPGLMAQEANRLCIKDKDRIVVCKYSGHIITFDYDATTLVQEIDNFWKSL